MKRVMVIGNAGGGKSRLALRLSRKLDLPLTEIDRIRWRPGWIPVPDEEFADAHRNLIAQDRWVIDGWGPAQSVQDRLAACDAVVLVDLSFRRHLFWALKRQVTSFLTGGREDPDGCPRWPHTWRLLRLMRGINDTDLPHLRADVAARQGTCRVIHLTTRSQLEAFARGLA
jgi:hypothetical protein